MSIKKDALVLLIKLYNDKVEGIKFDLDKVFNHLGFSKNRFFNAYDYLVERGLIHKGRSFIGTTNSGLRIIEDVTITSLGIDAIEEDEVLKDNFGSLKIDINQQGKVNIISQSGDKSPVKINAPYVEKPTYENVKEVIHGNKYESVSDSSIRYEGDVKDTFFIEKFSMFFINLLSERKVKYIGIISTIIGIIDIIGWTVSITYDIIPMTFNKYTTYVVGFGFLLIIIGLLFYKLYTHKILSKCPKCNKEYAMEEYKEPKVKDIDTRDGTRRTTTRFYKCKYCGYEEEDVDKELIPYDD
jgi:hypothetical protein